MPWTSSLSVSGERLVVRTIWEPSTSLNQVLRAAMPSGSHRDRLVRSCRLTSETPAEARTG
jgi:hypothetical protein